MLDSSSYIRMGVVFLPPIHLKGATNETQTRRNRHDYVPAICSNDGVRSAAREHKERSRTSAMRERVGLVMLSYIKFEDWCAVYKVDPTDNEQAQRWLDFTWYNPNKPCPPPEVPHTLGELT